MNYGSLYTYGQNGCVRPRLGAWLLPAALERLEGLQEQTWKELWETASPHTLTWTLAVHCSLFKLEVHLHEGAPHA